MTNAVSIGIILGQQMSNEVQFIYREIERQGHIPVIIDASLPTKHVRIEYHPNEAAFNLIVNSQKIQLSQIGGVYWASVNVSMVAPSHRMKDTASSFLDSVVTEPKMDAACLLQLFFAQTNINWVNSFAAIQCHRLKPKQLTLAKNLGANIPNTYIGNCSEAIAAFLKHSPDAIVKPIFAGGHTKRIPTSMTNDKEIAAWACAPITLQAYIPGVNIRTYIIGQFMISAKIVENYEAGKPELVSDYRIADSIKLIQHSLPIKMRQLSIHIMRAFHLQYTAIDWRLTPSGEYYFLEANPAPLFVEAQKQLGVEMDRAIVDLMFM